MKPFRPALFRLIAAPLIILLLSAAAKTNADALSSDDAFKVTTVYLVRHAERATAPPQDPPLLEAGTLRAQELARVLEKAGIKYIYTSQFLRTKLTAEPVAKQLGIAITAMPIKMSASNPREVSEESFRELADKVYESRGDSVLIVGHSNTVPEVIRALGGDIVPTIDEKEYNDLFVVTVYAKGKAKVAHMKYGAQR